MKIWIKSARIIDPDSPHHNKKRDILIESGKITRIGTNLNPRGAEKLEADNLHVSPGWFDMQAFVPDPGHEYKENLASACNAAMRGGFTGIALLPDTHPPRDSKSDIEYVINQCKSYLVDVHPYGAVSEGLKGENLTEMHDMKQAGAVGFTDGKHPVSNGNLQRLALQYSKDFGGLILSFPFEKNIAGKGIAHEGPVATSLGMATIPVLSEELMVNRDIYLAQYTGSRIHFSTLSAKSASELVKNARQKGTQVTAGVAAHHLLLTEDALSDFDSNAKVIPPFRSKSDRDAMRKAVAQGIIDVICSDHWPEDQDEKRKEFDLAAFGAVGFETAFAAAWTALEKTADLATVIKALSANPRRILGLAQPVVDEGQQANLTLFNPNHLWQVEEKQLASRSKNSPFLQQELKGKALGAINKGQVHWVG
ncbi:MAG: dihydroorotase [Flavobacteriales bacterium]|nr:dihydroorotase [Flavobacteriales bacterium]MCB9447898.1 dihydroorotase [Flavobacteriales bacterium]